jgi:hypothetical protein
VLTGVDLGFEYREGEEDTKQKKYIKFIEPIINWK